MVPTNLRLPQRRDHHPPKTLCSWLERNDGCQKNLLDLRKSLHKARVDQEHVEADQHQDQEECRVVAAGKVLVETRFRQRHDHLNQP